MDVTATVAGLYRYPVQSVGGESLPVAHLGAKGITGDRAYGIADLELGCIAHSSRAKKEYRGLIAWTARYLAKPGDDNDASPVELDFGDATIRSDDSAIDRVISERLGMKAAFVRNDGSRVPLLYERSPCHLLTTATLRRLQQHHATGAFAPARFRPNVFLDCGETVGFVEQEWMGRDVALGGATINIDDLCKRCALTTRAQGALPADPGILQATTLLNKAIAGVYGAVVREGKVETGDKVTVTL
ncbi:MAG: MOSC domain-containing protein [Rhodospirillaceae bacterium]|nr:MOSC domain-containing protein [Rhodospirillaceae bacterium]